MQKHERKETVVCLQNYKLGLSLVTIVFDPQSGFLVFYKHCIGFKTVHFIDLDFLRAAMWNYEGRSLLTPVSTKADPLNCSMY